MSSYRLLLTFCVLAPVLAYGTRRLSLRGRVFGPPKPEEDAFLPPDMWLDQQLDHFDHTNFKVSFVSKCSNYVDDPKETRATLLLFAVPDS